jgi:cell division septal protein FtsQ
VSERRLREESAPEERKARGWFWFALLVMLAVAGAAAYRSALFRATDIAVTGAGRLSRERVIQAAGLAIGAARWEHPAAAVEARLRQEPWIASATAAWEWGRLAITVKEREPVGLLRYSDRFYLVLDDTGVILGQAELDSKQNLPVVSGRQVSTALRGQQVPDPGLQDALLLLSRMQDQFRGQISEVAVADDRSLTLYMASGATVQWGTIPDGDDRLQGLQEKVTYFGGLWNGTVKKKTGGCTIDMRLDNSYRTLGCN